MEFNGDQWSLMEFIGVKCSFIKLNRVLLGKYNPLELNGVEESSLEFNRIRRISVVFSGYEWMSIDFNGVLWSSLEFNGVLRRYGDQWS